MKVRNKRKLLYIIGCALIIVYIMFIIILCSYMGLDSDKANHLLQAVDIISGNFFFKDWNLTGVTFITTDLIYYEFAALLFGISYKSIYVAGGLMISSVMIVSLLLCRNEWDDKKNCFKKCLLFLLLTAIPCRCLLNSFRVHTGALFLYLVCFSIFDSVIRNKTAKNNRKYVVYLILSCMGAIGDLLFVVEGLLPILVICFYRDVIEGKENSYKYRMFSVLSIFSIVFSVIWDKVYFWIGGANKNAYIGDMLFTSSNEWISKIQNFNSELMSLTMADFAGNRLSVTFGIVKIIYFAILLLALLYIIRIFLLLFTKRANEIDDISLLLCLCMVMAFTAYVFTDMSQARYITIIPTASIVLIIRNLNWITDKVSKKGVFECVIFLISGVCFMGKINEIRQYTSFDGNTELIGFLEQHNLTAGYASFWNASNNTVLSNGNINIRHITRNNSGFEMHNWFNKNGWYTENANFVLIRNIDNDRGENDNYGVSELNVISAFGEPIEKYELTDYIILVYDKDLSLELNNGLSDGVLTANEMLYMDNAKKKGKEIVIKKGGMVYGPYDKVDKGNYTVVINGDGIDNVTFDINSESSMENISYEIVSKNQNSISSNLIVNDKVNDIEIRVYNSTNNTAVLKNISIK